MTKLILFEQKGKQGKETDVDLKYISNILLLFTFAYVYYKFLSIN